LPDGCVEMVLNFGAHFREYQLEGEPISQPMQMLVGQMTRPVVIAPDGHVELIGVRFHPGGTLPFFAFPMSEISNQIVDLSATSGNEWRNLVEQVIEQQSLPKKLKTLERLLTTLVDRAKHDFSISHLTSRIVSSGGNVSVDELARSAGI